ELERLGHALARRLRDARVRLRRDPHADEPRERREERADDEADRGEPPERVARPEAHAEEDEGEEHGEDRDDAILQLEEGEGALADGLLDLLHARVAGAVAEDRGG